MKKNKLTNVCVCITYIYLHKNQSTSIWGGFCCELYTVPFYTGVSQLRGMLSPEQCLETCGHRNCGLYWHLGQSSQQRVSEPRMLTMPRLRNSVLKVLKSVLLNYNFFLICLLLYLIFANLHKMRVQFICLCTNVFSA